MRTKTSHDNDTLEPLAVYEDGVAYEPEPVSAPERHVGDAWQLARECVDAVRAVLDDREEIRAQRPWTPPEPPEPPTRAARFMSTFSRMTVLHPDQLVALPAWWADHARDGRVSVTRRLSLEAPRPSTKGTWRVRGRLRSAWLLRSIPVELLLWPHLGAWTKMSLEPQRHVHIGRRYFGKGHRVLDALTTQLIRELEPPRP